MSGCGSVWCRADVSHLDRRQYHRSRNEPPMLAEESHRKATFKRCFILLCPWSVCVCVCGWGNCCGTKWIPAEVSLRDSFMERQHCVAFCCFPHSNKNPHASVPPLLHSPYWPVPVLDISRLTTTLWSQRCEVQRTIEHRLVQTPLLVPLSDWWPSADTSLRIASLQQRPRRPVGVWETMSEGWSIVWRTVWRVVNPHLNLWVSGGICGKMTSLCYLYLLLYMCVPSTSINLFLSPHWGVLTTMTQNHGGPWISPKTLLVDILLPFTSFIRHIWRHREGRGNDTHTRTIINNTSIGWVCLWSSWNTIVPTSKY